MEISLRSSLDAAVSSDGAVVVPGRLLVDIARLLPGDEVSIDDLERLVDLNPGQRARGLPRARVV